MIRNTIECITDMFAFQDPVKDIISQRLKNHMQDDMALHLPGGDEMPVHTVEVQHQTKKDGLVEGGWVCDNA